MMNEPASIFQQNEIVFLQIFRTKRQCFCRFLHFEIDAVIECNGLICIEVKTGAERAYPSLRKTLGDGNITRRVIFEKGNISVDDDGIEHYPLFASAFLFPENDDKIDETRMDGLIGDPFV